MDRKKLEKQAQILRNKQLRYEERAHSLRQPRPKINNGAVVRKAEEPKIVTAMGLAPPVEADRSQMSQQKAIRAASLRKTTVIPSTGTSGCGGCSRRR